MDNSTTYVDAKRGKIKWYNNNKGYGFITGDDGEEVFLHNSMINNHAHGEKIEEGIYLENDDIDKVQKLIDKIQYSDAYLKESITNKLNQMLQNY